MSRAVVFAYHNVGVRCLAALLARGVQVPLVVTHRDNPAEAIWFDSVAALAASHGIAVITPNDPNTEAVLAQVQAAAPDFLFSFYYRQMLGAPLLATAPRGAFNMHGSLLPRYRGRVPINWAVLHGEHETGATLHAMTVKPDNGAIVDQMAVPILPDDTAHEVFAKVTVAAELVLWRCLPALLAGQATLRPQDLSQGGYFGGRKAEDGRINPLASAAALHNLVRAVSHPYPGAFADLPQGRLHLWQTRHHPAPAFAATTAPRPVRATLHADAAGLWLHAADGAWLRVTQASLDGTPLDGATFGQRVGAASLVLPALS